MDLNIDRESKDIDPARIYTLYCLEGLPITQIADELDSTRYIVKSRIDEYGIGLPYKNEKLLRTLYWELGLSTTNISDLIGRSRKTITNWMGEFDIETREAHDSRPPSFHTDDRGYERWVTSYNGETYYMYVHRLLAVAEHGYEAVAGNDIHHKIPVPWANWHGNVVPMEKSDHGGISSRSHWEIDSIQTIPSIESTL